MKRRQITSILLSLLLASSAFCSLIAQMSVFAAEETVADEMTTADEETAISGDEENTAEVYVDEEAGAEEPIITNDDEREDQSSESAADDEETPENNVAEDDVSEDNASDDNVSEDDASEDDIFEDIVEDMVSSQYETDNELKDSQSSGPIFKGAQPVTMEGQKATPEDKGEKSSYDLFADYVEKSFGGQTSQAEQSGRKRAPKSAAAGLSGIDKAIYENIASGLPQIAAGERASTVFEIAVNELGLDKTFWTAGELGIPSIFTLDESGDIIVDDEGNASISEEAIAAIEEMTTYDLSIVIDALLADYPYQLYWYEKTQETTSTGYEVTSLYDDEAGDYVVGITGVFLISFPVAEEYSAGDYLVDMFIGQSVQTSVAKANAIVMDHTGESDFEKLCSYREEICNLVSYNEEAAAGGVSYGNPWQMIWVFDEDPETNVVCEGYAKAFKYLCDQTEFSGDISCITVTGTMTGGTGEGPHMWNIVNMEDGKKYLTDITNCDRGTIGEPDLLFLAGYSIMDGTDSYTITTENGSVSYTYGQDTLSLYGADFLILSENSYRDTSAGETVEYIENDIVYSITGETATVVGYRGVPSDVVLPETVKGATVKRISGSAFMRCGTLRSICIASTIEVIEDGKYNSWEGLGPDFNGAFFECNALETVTFAPNSRLRIIGEYAFLRCELLSDIILPTSVEELRLSAFDSCISITEIILHEGLKIIGQNAFSNCPITKLELPSTLTQYDPWCNIITLESYEVAEGNEIYRAEDGVLYIKDEDTWQLLAYPASKRDETYRVPDFIGDEFDGSDLNGKESIKFLDIGKRKFSGGLAFGQLMRSYYNLNCEVIVDDDNPFYTVKDGVLYSKDMTMLLQVPSSIKGHFEVPDHVLEIDNWAFSNCCDITSVSLPPHIKSLNNTFSGCTSLVHIDLPNGINSLEGTFSGCTSLPDIELPSGIKSLYATFSRCDSLRRVVLPEGVETIERVFWCCENLEEVVIPESVTYIGAETFETCPNLKKITFLADTFELDPIAFWNFEYDDVVICGHAGSTAESIANDRGYIFIPLEESGAADDVIEMIELLPEHAEEADRDEVSDAAQAYEDLSIIYRKLIPKRVLNKLLDDMILLEIPMLCGTCVMCIRYRNNDGYTDTWSVDIINPATCINKGEIVYECVICKHIRREEIEINPYNHDLYYLEGVSETYTNDGYLAHYQCGRCGKLFSDGNGHNEISIEDITIPSKFRIVGQPADVYASKGNWVEFKVETEGVDLLYQWQWSSDGRTWKNCTSEGFNTNAFSFVMKDTLAKRRYRCVVKKGTERVYSEAAELHLEVNGISCHPEDVEAFSGEQVSFYVDASGEDLLYQWQWSTDKKSWKNCSSAGYNTDTFSFKMKPTLSGRFYRCVITRGEEKLISEAASIILASNAEITRQPSNTEAAIGENVVFTVEVFGENPSYQWQWSSNGMAWKNCTSTGCNTDTFSFKMKESLSGRLYRCKVVAEGKTMISEEALISLAKNMEIIKQPDNAEALTGEKVAFSVEVRGDNVSYQWQYCSDGKTWKNCTSAGFNTNTFSFIMKASLSGRLYRCKVSDGFLTVYSNAASLSVLNWPVTIDGVIYDMVGNTVTVIGADLFSVSLDIKEDVHGKTVTSINENAFIQCSLLTAVVVPGTVIEIGDSAFRGCDRLTSVVLSNGLKTIGEYAFSKTTSLSEIAIPDSVTGIGIGAFQCSALNHVTLSNSVTLIDDLTFACCSQLESIVVPNGITDIGNISFTGCSNLVDVSLPETLLSIGQSAFEGCTNLSTIHIPERVESIGDAAFKDCFGLTEFSVDSGNVSYTAKDEVLMNRAETVLIAYPGGKNEAVYSIPDTVRTIETYAFSGCTYLSDIILSYRVRSVGWNAFSNCLNLEHINLPASLAEMDNQEFYNCPNLKSIDVSTECPLYSSEDGVLFNKAKTLLIAYPAGKQDMAYTIPDYVSEIAEDAFRNCKKLKSVHIPSTVSTIGAHAFYDCDSLERIEFPEGLTTIRSYTFWECDSLGSVYIPDSVSRIEEGAFMSCFNLSDIYYGGTQGQWNSISINYVNNEEELSNTTIHYTE